MIKELHLNPPVVIRVGAGHWKPPKPVTLEMASHDDTGVQLEYRRFRLLMDEVVIYHGGGYGVQWIGSYVISPDNPPEIRLDPAFLLPVKSGTGLC